MAERCRCRANCLLMRGYDLWLAVRNFSYMPAVERENLLLMDASAVFLEVAVKK